MVLNDMEIRERIAFSRLVEIPDKPYSKNWRYYNTAIQPASYDFRLSSDFKRVKSLEWRKIDNLYVDIEEPVEYADQPYRDGLTLQPREFMLGFTEEVVNMPADLGAFLSSRSSLGRAGLLVTFSTWVNPGYCGRISVELFNASNVPLRIRSGIRVLQGIFVPLTGRAEYEYMGKYQNSIEPTGSRFHEEFVSQKGAGHE